MRTVIITQGAYGYKPENGSVRAVMRGQSVCIPDAEAARIVALGVAEYEDADAHEAEAEKDAFYDPEELSKLTVAELRGVAEGMAIDVSDCRRKADFIGRIVASGEDDGDDGDGEEMPALGAVDPV